MGWNDHVTVADTECQDCGAVSCWEYWDAVALARYSGALGQKLGHDATQAGKCPHCGSSRGAIVDPDDDIDWGSD